MQEMQHLQVWSLGWEDPLEEKMATCLQYSCLENPMDRGAWRVTVHGVSKSQTWLRGWAHTLAHTYALPTKGISPFLCKTATLNNLRKSQKEPDYLGNDLWSGTKEDRLLSPSPFRLPKPSFFPTKLHHTGFCTSLTIFWPYYWVHWCSLYSLDCSEEQSGLSSYLRCC